MTEIKIFNNEILDLLENKAEEFPKYASQLINLANQNSGGTRPKVVGQMSELIQDFKGKKMKEWEDWYLEQHPEAISIAANKIIEMMNNFKEVITKIDTEMIEKWVRDLVIIKTFIGLKFQEAILKSIANYLKVTYQLSEPYDEAQGIDGFINNKPISIKPVTYITKFSLPEEIVYPIIYYEKVKNGIKIKFDGKIF